MVESRCSPDICVEALMKTTKTPNYGHVPVEIRTVPFRKKIAVTAQVKLLGRWWW